MEYLLTLSLALLIMFFFKKLFLVSNQESLNKEDAKLKDKQEELNKDIEDLKNELKKDAPQLTPEEVEKFWSKK